MNVNRTACVLFYILVFVYKRAYYFLSIQVNVLATSS